VTDCTAIQPKKQPTEINRRRSILWHYIGQQVTLKRTFPIGRDTHLRELPATLSQVNRTRVLLDFGDCGEWFFPVSAVLLPGSTEPAPGQRQLFDGEAQR